MDYTKNLQLGKPRDEEYYSVDVFNHNADLIDEAVSAHKHAAGDITSGVLPPERGGTGQNSLANVTVGKASVCTGNAATATKLQTARKINGVSFDGGADITVTAAADGGNADTVDGFHANSFTRNMPNLSIDDLNNSSYLYSYICDVFGTDSIAMGLSDEWWHVIYLPHRFLNGHGSQIVVPLNKNDLLPRYRMASDGKWTNWKLFADGGNADTVDGLHANVFTRNMTNLPIADLTNNKHPYSYICDIQDSDSAAMGLPFDWWHVIYLPHRYLNEHGAQIAVPLNNLNFLPRYRISSGKWSEWKLFADGGNADMVDGSHAWQMQTLDSNGNSQGPNSWVATLKYNVDNDYRFKLVVSGNNGEQTKVDYANAAGNAGKLAGLGLSNNAGGAGIVRINGDYGELEIGKYLDFHTASGQDYASRLEASVNGIHAFSPSANLNSLQIRNIIAHTDTGSAGVMTNGDVLHVYK